MERILYIVIGILVVGRFVWMVRDTVSGEVLTGPGTVVSRRVETSRHNPLRNAKTWHVHGYQNYLVTFRLSDGEEIELHTFENLYRGLKEGSTGQLTWCKNSLSEFVPDPEEETQWKSS